MKILVIAQVAHAINAAYCLSLGDISQVSWDDAPEWQRQSAIAGVEMHLANPDATPEQAHESWLAQKLADGWTFGEVKDAEKKVHPCCLPFAELPAEQKSKDYLFRAVVHALKDIPDADDAVADAVAAALANQPKAAAVQVAAATVAPLGQIGVQYIGRRQTFTDHLYGTGLSFEREQVRNLPADLARKFLRHGDQFRQAEAVPVVEQVAQEQPEAEDDTAKQLAEVQQRQLQEQQEQNALQDLRDRINLMDKDALEQFAKTNYRQDIDKRQGVGKLRAQVIGMVDQFGPV